MLFLAPRKAEFFIDKNMLTKEQKKKIIKDLAEKIKSAKAVVFADFKGLAVQDTTFLKRKFREIEGGFKVVKKTLLNIALKESERDVNASEMEGQIAVSYSAQDEVAPAKIIFDFAKKNENLKIVGGILEKRGISAEEVAALAKLPAKEQLLAQLVGSLASPLSGLMNVFQGNQRSLVRVLKAISENK